MKKSRLLHLLVLIPAPMLGQQAPVGSLKSLLETLPALLRTGQFQSDNGAAFFERVTATIAADPEKQADALPAFRRNLTDDNAEVRFDTMVIVSQMGGTTQGLEIIKSLTAEMVSTIGESDEPTQRAALAAAEALNASAPDSLVEAIEKKLSDRKVSGDVTVDAATTLVVVRPNDSKAQLAILSAINGERLPLETRLLVLKKTASSDAGEMLVQNVIRLVNTAQDKPVRDAAVIAAGKIGPRATAQVKTRLGIIANDPSESQASRKGASAALAGSGA